MLSIENLTRTEKLRMMEAIWNDLERSGLAPITRCFFDKGIGADKNLDVSWTRFC